MWHVGFASCGALRPLRNVLLAHPFATRVCLMFAQLQHSVFLTSWATATPHSDENIKHDDDAKTLQTNETFRTQVVFMRSSDLRLYTLNQTKIALRSLYDKRPKVNHINVISKFGMLEYKHGRSESGRTNFEAIVTNYPKRMDIWSIYMDMEVKYGGKDNAVQARHLFERCLSLSEI